MLLCALVPGAALPSALDDAVVPFVKCTRRNVCKTHELRANAIMRMRLPCGRQRRPAKPEASTEPIGVLLRTCVDAVPHRRGHWRFPHAGSQTPDPGGDLPCCGTPVPSKGSANQCGPRVAVCGDAPGNRPARGKCDRRGMAATAVGPLPPRPISCAVAQIGPSSSPCTFAFGRK